MLSQTEWSEAGSCRRKQVLDSGQTVHCVSVNVSVVSPVFPSTSLTGSSWLCSEFKHDWGSLVLSRLSLFSGPEGDVLSGVKFLAGSGPLQSSLSASVFRSSASLFSSVWLLWWSSEGWSLSSSSSTVFTVTGVSSGALCCSSLTCCSSGGSDSVSRRGLLSCSSGGTTAFLTKCCWTTVENNYTHTC